MKRKKTDHYALMEVVVRRMLPLLKVASEHAHADKAARTPEPDDEDDAENYAYFDHTVELGFVVQAASNLCAPHLSLLADIAHALGTIEDPEHGDEDKPPKRKGNVVNLMDALKQSTDLSD